MLVIGLTGTIASGKSTTAAMFADEGVPVFSADAAVHALYQGPAAPVIGKAFPGALVDGEVDRARLALLLAAEGAIERLEAIVHPLVRAEERRFLDEARAAGHAIALVEHPLLFETGAAGRFDRVIVTTAPADVRRRRALARPPMTAETYELLGSRQWTDAKKREGADYVVDTGPGLDAARSDVRHILAELKTEAGAGRRDA